MGNRVSLESDGEFFEGMREVADRGFGSFRLVSLRDIFKKPLLTSSESSSTTTEDLAERCPCKFHEEEQETLQNVVDNCCRCNRPKITEPADCCPCQCHITVQKQLNKCCLSRTRINTTNSSGDNQLEQAPSEQSVGSSPTNSRSNIRVIIDWIFSTGSEETSNFRSSDCDNEPEQMLPEESQSAISVNRWSFQIFTRWIFQSSSKESQSSPSAGNLPMEKFAEETSSCSSFDDLSDSFKVASEESLSRPPTARWWDFHTILYWMHQAESVNAQNSSDENPSQQAPPEKVTSK